VRPPAPDNGARVSFVLAWPPWCWSVRPHRLPGGDLHERTGSVPNARHLACGRPPGYDPRPLGRPGSSRLSRLAPYPAGRAWPSLARRSRCPRSRRSKHPRETRLARAGAPSSGVWWLLSSTLGPPGGLVGADAWDGLPRYEKSCQRLNRDGCHPAVATTGAYDCCGNAFLASSPLAVVTLAVYAAPPRAGPPNRRRGPCPGSNHAIRARSSPTPTIAWVVRRLSEPRGPAAAAIFLNVDCPAGGLAGLGPAAAAFSVSPIGPWADRRRRALVLAGPFFWHLNRPRPGPTSTVSSRLCSNCRTDNWGWGRLRPPQLLSSSCRRLQRSSSLCQDLGPSPASFTLRFALLLGGSRTLGPSVGR